jgi:serine/threonine protein kinase
MKHLRSPTIIVSMLLAWSSAAQAAHKPGDKITIGGVQYTVKEILREGAQDVPYRVEDAHAKSFVIKEVKEEAVYTREKSLMVKVKGDVNVVQILGHDDGKKLILMEYSKHTSLQNYLKGHGVEEAVAKKLVKDILAGVTFIHGKGVCEGDLDAKNVFVDETPQGVLVAKVADFGGSYELSDEHESGDRFAIVSPIAQLASNKKISGWGTLSAMVAKPVSCSDHAFQFLKDLKTYATSVLAWKNDHTNAGKRTAARTAFTNLKADGWLQ